MGRPPKDPAIKARALALVDQGFSPEQAAEELARKGIRISWRTIHRAREERERARNPHATPPAVVAPSAIAAAPRAVLAPKEPFDPFALVRRIFAARDPAALVEMEEGLAEADKGEAAFDAWLRRPLFAAGANVDPLHAAAAGLGALVEHAKRLSPLHPRAAPLYGQISNLAARVEKIANGRPREVTRDEVEERIAARRDEAVAKICEYTKEAHAKLEADRVELSAWGRSVLGPVGGAELDRRVGLMLGEAE
jgi:hypothetical protein